MKARCGYCRQWFTVEGSPERIDQLAYMAIWQHVAAAHWRESKGFRQLSVDERKELVMRWAKQTTPS